MKIPLMALYSFNLACCSIALVLSIWNHNTPLIWAHISSVCGWACALMLFYMRD